MGGVWLALWCFTAPATGASEQPTQAQREAWEAAGWGEAPAPEDETETDARAEPEATSREDAPSEEQEAAWEAAGWGQAPAEEPGQGEGEGEGEGAGEQRDAAEGEGAGESEAVDDTGEQKVRVGDVLGGSLRLTGAFLHFDDEPELFPNGDDALALTVGRVLVEADAGRHVHLSFNGFFELARSPLGSGLGGSFASAGSTASAYRTRYLGWTYWESGAIAGQLGVDRAAMRLSFDTVNLDIGRFPVNYAVTTMFTTNDFFAPFSATAVNRIYKPGVDAVRLSAGLTPTASVDVVGVMGYDPETDRPDWGRAAVLTRAAWVAGGFEWAVLGGKVSQRWVAGGSAQGGIGPVTFRTEFHVGFPDAEGDGHNPSSDHPIYARVAAGPALTFAWHNAMIGAEYLFASDGAERPASYLQRLTRSYTDDLPYLGKHYLAAVAGLEIIPILRASATALVSATDGSGLAGISFSYSVADESDLILGVFVPWGKGLVAFDPLAQTLELGSEFGLSPLTAYLEARVFF